MPAHKPLSIRSKRLRRQWVAWKRKENWFARGAFAKVFDKKESKYPKKSYFISRGALTKLYIESPKPSGLHEVMARRTYYGLKVAHELYPSFTVTPRAFVKSGTGKRQLYFEIHVERVPLSAGLIALNEAKVLAHGGAVSSRDVMDARTTAIAQVTQEEHHSHHVLERVLGRMRQAGIGTDRNIANFSLYRPAHPVLLEPRIDNSQKARAMIEQSAWPAKKKRRALAYLTLWEKYNAAVLKKLPELVILK